MRANVQTFSEIFCKRSDVRARGARHARVKVEGAVKIVLDQLPARFDSFELVNTNVYRFSLNTLTAARELVDFFGRVHRRYLVYLAAKSLQSCFDLLVAPVPRVRWWTTDRIARAIAGVR